MEFPRYNPAEGRTEVQRRIIKARNLYEFLGKEGLKELIREKELADILDITRGGKRSASGRRGRAGISIFHKRSIVLMGSGYERLWQSFREVINDLFIKDWYKRPKGFVFEGPFFLRKTDRYASKQITTTYLEAAGIIKVEIHRSRGSEITLLDPERAKKTVEIGYIQWPYKTLDEMLEDEVR